MFNEPPYNLTDFENYSPTWNTPMKVPSSDLFSLPNFTFYPP